MKMTWSEKRVSFVLLIMKMSLLENILSSVHVEAPSIMPVECRNRKSYENNCLLNSRTVPSLQG
jgi:hypothetical protein